jgi:hypothetical protein
MTVTEDTGEETTDGTAEADVQALFEEARRRRRRRYRWSAATIVVLAVTLTLGLLVSTGSRSRITPTNTSDVGGTGARHSVRTVTFAGSFVPQQIVAASGKIWVVGTTQPDNLCAIEEIDPSSLRMRRFPLPACGSYVAAGSGQIYLADGVFTAATDSEAFHIESFDTTTHGAVVMAPVDLTTTGTGYAHMAMTYGGGYLWLNPWSDHVLEISPSTGAVVATISDTLFPGGGHPALVAGPSGLWLAGGPGGPAVIERLAPGSTRPVTVYK